MPHATASWLVDTTSLTFQQIAEFCGLHILEVQAIADDTAATKLTGRDPLRSGELTQEEIERGQADPDYKLQMQKEPDQAVRTKGPRYTPVSKRQDKPDGVAWLLRNHPEISDGAISKLIGTTRTTIAAIRDRSHWNIANIQPKDPVTRGLCALRELYGLKGSPIEQYLVMVILLVQSVNTPKPRDLPSEIALVIDDDPLPECADVVQHQQFDIHAATDLFETVSPTWVSAKHCGVDHIAVPCSRFVVNQ